MKKKCCQCGKKFDVDFARAEYENLFPEDDMTYDEIFPDHDFCGLCAIAFVESNIAIGREIDEWNGDDDY